MQGKTLRRLIESGFYAGVFTMSGFGFYYTIGLVLTLAQGGDPVKFFLDSIVAGFFAFLFFWMICWEISGMFERANERGRRDRTRDQDPPDTGKSPSDKPDGSGTSGSRRSDDSSSTTGTSSTRQDGPDVKLGSQPGSESKPDDKTGNPPGQSPKA
jgi:hypothetical protein